MAAHVKPLPAVLLSIPKFEEKQKKTDTKYYKYYQWRIQDFPLGGGAPSHWGGADLQRGCFSVKTYVKTKELDPVGGGGRAGAPGSANDYHGSMISLEKKTY